MRISFRWIYALFLLGSIGCSNKKRNTIEIIDAMHRYDRHLLSMNTDSIASSFQEDGRLGTIAKGRDSIRKFLAKFSEYKVLEQSSISDSIVIYGDTADQSGRYYQTTILPDKDTVHIKGLFSTKWVWSTQTGWLIEIINTKPTH